MKSHTNATAKANEPSASPVRIDAWLWSTRFFKTRAEATKAVKAGHVLIGDKVAKPSSPVVPGLRVTLWKDDREFRLEINATVSKRVGAKIAEHCYIDHSPPAPPKPLQPTVPKRDPGAGRPTKKDRREMEKFTGKHRS
ncbi:RNA-binding S4 domain-containing protein [Corynebacterium sp. MNWGS58]|uniref:RNA-binding S4 domain-containing protein n=1 Tax=Corynebacterium sp. 102791.4 TaxID=3104612 RepID=UPI0035127068